MTGTSYDDALRAISVKQLSRLTIPDKSWPPGLASGTTSSDPSSASPLTPVDGVIPIYDAIKHKHLIPTNPDPVLEEGCVPGWYGAVGDGHPCPPHVNLTSADVLEGVSQGSVPMKADTLALLAILQSAVPRLPSRVEFAPMPSKAWVYGRGVPAPASVPSPHKPSFYYRAVEEHLRVVEDAEAGCLRACLAVYNGEVDLESAIRLRWERKKAASVSSYEDEIGERRGVSSLVPDNETKEDTSRRRRGDKAMNQAVQVLVTGQVELNETPRVVRAREL